VKSSGEDLNRVARMIREKSVRPLIDRVFSLQEAGVALDYSRSLRAKGKIVLEVNSSPERNA